MVQVSESIGAEWRPGIMKMTTRSMPPESVMVGKPPNTLGPCLTAYGYSRRFDASRTTSAMASASDTGGKLTHRRAPLGCRSGVPNVGDLWSGSGCQAGTHVISRTPVQLCPEMTRPEVKQLFLLVEPDVQPVASVILFPGGSGKIKLWKKDQSHGQGRLPCRSA